MDNRALDAAGHEGHTRHLNPPARSPDGPLLRQSPRAGPAGSPGSSSSSAASSLNIVYRDGRLALSQSLNAALAFLEDAILRSHHTYSTPTAFTAAGPTEPAAMPSATDADAPSLAAT